MSGRCKACNAKMTDFEMTRKEAETGRYVDLCTHCFKQSDYEDIPVIERGDLGSTDDGEGLDVPDFDTLHGLDISEDDVPY